MGKEGGNQFRRGAQGGVEYRGGRQGYEYHEIGKAESHDYGQGRGRGRGGDRGRGGGGRGGKGGRYRGECEKTSDGPPNTQRSEDFPSLPSSQPSVEPLASPTGEKQSWADQVETVQAAKDA